MFGDGTSASLSRFFSRGLRLAGDAPEESRRLLAFRLYLMIHAPFELLWDSLIWESDRAYYGVAFAAGLLASLALSRVAGREILGARVYVGFHLAVILWLFPAVSNHFFLAFSCLLLLSVLDLENDRERLLGLQAIRWMTVIVLFYSGLQKVLYGTYFQAQLLAWTIAHDARFKNAFGKILPADEALRLQALADTAGPFGSEWWPLVFISNFTYLFEMVAPLLLFHPRTRSAAVAATVLFLLLIETAAREYFFGCLFVNMVALFARRNWYPVLLPLTAAVYAFQLIPRLDRIWEWW